MRNKRKNLPLTVPSVSSTAAGTSDEEKEAGRRFRLNVRQTIQRIRDGFSLDLDTAIRNGGSGYKAIPRVLYAPFFEAIFVNLENFERYNAPGPAVDRRARFDLVWVFLFALGNFDREFIQRNDAVAEMILEKWRTVIKWLRILTKDTVDDNVTIISYNKSCSQIIADLFYKLTSASKTKHILWEEEVITFAFDFWSRTDHDFKAESFSSLILSQCVLNNELDLPRLEEISKWELSSIMDLLISRLRFAATYVQEDLYLVKYCVALLRFFLNKDHEALEDLCLSLDAVGALLSVIRSYSKRWIDLTNSDRLEHVDLVDKCLRAVHKILDSLPGSKCMEAINMALRRGLMKSLLLTRTYASLGLGNGICDAESFPIKFLSMYLPRLLVIASCTRNSVKATQKLKPSELEAIATGHPVFRSAWCALQRTLSYRVASAAYFRLNKPFYRCSNVRCKMAGTRYRFLRCGGCEERMYCSEDCQRVAWKSQRHRTLCDEISNETVSVLNYESRINGYAHITLLAMAELKRHMPTLRRVAAIDFPDIDFNDLGYVVDLTTNPPTLSVKDVEAIRTEQSTHVVDDIVERMGSYDHRQVAILRIDMVLDLWSHCVQPIYRLVELDKSGTSSAHLADMLERGEDSGGKRRGPCVVKCTSHFPMPYVEYDLIDEIVRRADEQMVGQPLLCNDEYVAVVQEEAELLLDELGNDAINTIYV